MQRPAARAQPTDEEIMRGAQPATWISLRESSASSASGSGGGGGDNPSVTLEGESLDGE